MADPSAREPVAVPPAGSGAPGWRGYETVFNGVQDGRLRSVLVVVAHPLDLAPFGGTVEALAERQVRLGLVVVTPGDKLTESLRPGAGDGNPDRYLEAVAAGGRFAPIIRLPYLEAELPPHPELRRRIVEAVRAQGPDVVLTLDANLSRHPDHARVAQAVMEAAWPSAASDRLELGAGPPHRVKEVWLAGAALPDLFVTLDSGAEEAFAQVDLRHAGVFP